MTKPTVSPSRIAAFKILEQVFDENKTLLEVLPYIESSCKNINDRALAREIVSGTCRWWGKLRYQLKKFAKNLDGLPTPVQRILEMSVYQILYLDRVPSYAIISEAVNLTRKQGFKGFASVVNGILRNIDRQSNGMHEIQAKLWSETIAARESFPVWMIKRWEELWGREATESFCAFSNTIAPLSLRLRNEEKGLELLQSKKITYHRDERIPSRVEIQTDAPFPHSLLNHPMWTVQDGASMLIPLLIDPQPNWTVWDVCAAPGGKTFFLADMMQNQGKIWATDRGSKRLHQLKTRKEELNLSCVEPRVMDVLKDSIPWPENTFDAVLVDAPCTGWGTLRRHPDLRWHLKFEDSQRLGQLALRMLERVRDYVKPGGILVYSTCTLSPEENQDVIRRFLEKNSSFCLQSHASRLHYDFENAFHKEGWLEIFPPRWKMDGMFAACMQKL